jgi:hypothetical protein
VAQVAVVAAVEGRDVRGDELAVAERQGSRGVLLVQEEVGERGEAGIHVWSVGGEGHHARLVRGQGDVGHGW